MKLKTPPKKTRAIIQMVQEIYLKVRRSYRTFGYYFLEIKHDFEKALKKAGFKFKWMGGYKRVYQHPAYPEFVVKVYMGLNYYKEDSNVSKLPRFLRKHFLEFVVKNRLYMIQPCANGKTKSKWSAANALEEKVKDSNKLYHFDAFGDNIRYHNGEPVIVDFCG